MTSSALLNVIRHEKLWCNSMFICKVKSIFLLIFTKILSSNKWTFGDDRVDGSPSSFLSWPNPYRPENHRNQTSGVLTTRSNTFLPTWTRYIIKRVRNLTLIKWINNWKSGLLPIQRNKKNHRQESVRGGTEQVEHNGGLGELYMEKRLPPASCSLFKWFTWLRNLRVLWSWGLDDASRFALSKIKEHIPSLLLQSANKLDQKGGKY